MKMQNSVIMLTTDSQIDRRIIHESDSLQSDGWKVIIIAPPSVKSVSLDDPRIVRLPLHENNGRFIKSLLLFRLYRWINRHIPISNRIKVIFRKIAWFIFLDLEKFYLNLFQATVEKYSPTVFVAHDLPMLPVACYAASKCGAKIVYDSHELFAEQEFSEYEKRKWKALESKYIGKCDLIITVNPMIAEELKKRYKLSSDVEVIYNAVSTSYKIQNKKIFHEIFNLQHDCKIILLQGGLTSNRNLEALVESMSVVTNPLLHLVILGDGSLKDYLQKIALKLNLNPRVHFHSAVPQEALLNYTASADLGIIPYQKTCLNNYYCTPNKLFEFIAAGIPILASDLPAIRAIISNYEIGKVADLRSAKQIASSLDLIFSKPEFLYTYKKNVIESQKTIKWDDNKIINLFKEYKCASL